MEGLTREELLVKLGAARAKTRAAWRLVDVEVAPKAATFSFALNRNKLRKARRREGRYLLRANLGLAQLYQVAPSSGNFSGSGRKNASQINGA